MKPQLLRRETTESDEFFDPDEATPPDLPPPPISFLPPTPADPTASPSNKKEGQTKDRRRRKLDNLRRRMRSEDDDFEDCQDGLAASSESTSLASWGRGVLGSDGVVAAALDSQSTRGPLASPLRLSPEEPGSLGQLAARLARSSPATTMAQGESSGSSKSGTLESYATPEALGSKSSSLDRPAYVTPASSLEKQVRSQSSGLGEDGGRPRLKDINRKNSEAAEFIEALTKQVVGVRPRFPRALPRLLPTKDVPRVEDASPLSGKSASLERPVSLGVASPLSAARKAHLLGQPDVVASAVRSSSGTSLHVEPVAPPRKGKLGPREEKSFSGEPSTSAPASGRSNTYSGRTTSCHTYANKEMLHEKTATAKSSKDVEDARAMPLDPLSLEFHRRMSAKFPGYHEGKSLCNSSMMSSTDSISTGDALSIASLPQKERSYLTQASFRARTMKKALGKRLGHTMWATAHGVRKVSSRLGTPGDESTASEEEPEEADGEDGAAAADARVLRVRSRHHKKGPFDFEGLRHVQDLAGEHSGAVWCVKFSACGRLLATAGQDSLIRVWVLRESAKTFADMRAKYDAGVARSDGDTNLAAELAHLSEAAASAELRSEAATPDFDSEPTPEDLFSPFLRKPFCCYRGHQADVLNVCWSKSYFLLSSSMDKTVRLWHVSRNECLCVFQHIDFVTSIAFLQDDKFFISGSFDGKLRVWSITEKKVALWNELEGNRFITALAFVNNGKYVVAGTFDGKCVFYSTEQLKYHTMIDVKSSRGKNARPHKVTGLSVFPDKTRGDKLLVTSNDSRIRLYDLNNLSLTCKYKGATNQDSQISASFSPDGKHIICGSEDRYFYLWRTSIDSLTLGVRKDRNRMWEKVRAHQAVVTATVFAPKPDIILAQVERSKAKLASLGLAAPDSASLVSAPATPDLRGKAATTDGDVIVTADFAGSISVFLNKPKAVKAGASTFFSANY